MLYNAWPVIITALLHALLCLSTYSTTQTATHTHTMHPVLTVIYSTLALSPTSSVCSHTASQMSERERQRGRPRVGVARGLKVKENLESVRSYRDHAFAWLYIYICVLFRSVRYMFALRKYPSFTH